MKWGFCVPKNSFPTALPQRHPHQGPRGSPSSGRESLRNCPLLAVPLFEAVSRCSRSGHRRSEPREHLAVPQQAALNQALLRRERRALGCHPAGSHGALPVLALQSLAAQ